MKEIGESVDYRNLQRKIEEGYVLKRAIDYENGFINDEELHASGRFDYLISVERNGKTEHVFCQNEDLE